ACPLRPAPLETPLGPQPRGARHVAVAVTAHLADPQWPLRPLRPRRAAEVACQLDREHPPHRLHARRPLLERAEVTPRHLRRRQRPVLILVHLPHHLPRLPHLPHPHPPPPALPDQP